MTTADKALARLKLDKSLAGFTGVDVNRIDDNDPRFRWGAADWLDQLEAWWVKRWNRITDSAAPLPDGWSRNHCMMAEGLVRQGIVEEGSAIWYCAQILDIISWTRNSPPDDAGIYWFTLGQHIAEADLLLRQHDALRIGGKTAGALQAGRAAANSARQAARATEHRRWITAASDVWKQNPCLGVSSCARAIIKRLELGEAKKTVSDIIRPHKPKKVGEAG